MTTRRSTSSPGRPSIGTPSPGSSWSRRGTPRGSSGTRSGSRVSARYWVNQLRGLERALRVVALDLPGHGQSEPVPHPGIVAYGEVAARLLDALGTGPVIAAGHSLGGAVAIELAARQPDAV